MQFMLIVKATAASEAGILPSRELMEAMGKFNQEMMDAGVFLTAEGLKDSSKGARVNFLKGGKRTITDGPFAETKELIAGYWVIKVKSRQEAIDWAMRSPSPFGDDTDAQIEIRQCFEPEDFV